MRPGRFDRSIQCDPPDVKGRREILMIYLAKLTLAEPIDEVADTLFFPFFFSFFKIRRHTPFSPHVAPRFPHTSEMNSLFSTKGGR